MKIGKTFLLVCMCSVIFGYGQQTKLSEIATTRYGTKWVQIKEGTNIKATQLFEVYKSAFGLKAEDDMRLLSTETDDLGFTHYRYQQFHKGVAVNGAIYLLHEKNGFLKSANGEIYTAITSTSNASIRAKQAVENAIAWVSAEEYAWQNKVFEQDIKSINKSKNATHYPSASLMYYRKSSAENKGDFRLVYRVEVLATKPLKRVAVFVDAQSGEIYHTTNILMNIDKPTKAVTRYNGTKDIVVDSMSASQYILRESGRGNGITTKDLQNLGDMVNVNTNAAVNIIETDTFFNNDLTANSAHWASEMTYDYYMVKFNRNSYNNSGAAMYSYVHWGNNIANAMWTGTAMVYGDGDVSNGPFTTAEICGHEITHAVTQYTANLEYEYESGALNESYSDMFGAMVNYFATDTINWMIGLQTGSAFRNMANPKQFQNPDTYKGQYWQTSSADNGGVHTNSGVGNYWFSLIVKGDTGTNDFGYHYNITPIGSEKSEKIAYRALSQYLTPTSQYFDCFQATIQAANDLYGQCSPESQTVAAAWAAVNVGYPFDTAAVYVTEVLSPISDCGLSNEQLTVKLFYNGCNRSLNVGAKIYIMAKVDLNTTYYDTLTLTSAFVGGTSMDYSLTPLINVATIGNHRVDVWVKGGSLTSYSDSVKNYVFSNRVLQNIDFAPVQVLSPSTSCFLGTQETVSMSFTYLGCAPLPATDSVRLAFKANASDTVFEYKHLTQVMNYGDTLTYTFLGKADCSLIGANVIQVFAVNPTDTFRVNNVKSISLTKPQFTNGHGPFIFSETDINNYYYKEIVNVGKVRTKVITGYPNGRVLNLTGGNVFSYYDQLIFPTPGQEWSVNEMLSAKANFCVDARLLTRLHIGFDLKQTSGGDLYAQYLGAGDYSSASIMRILVNGQHLNNQTYKPTTTGADPFVNRIVDLSGFIGNILEVSFETRNIASDTLGFTLDNTYIDNLHFIENSGDNVAEQSAGMSVALYPNPATHQTNLYLNVSEMMIGNLQVIDFLGKVLVAKPVLINSGENIITIDLNGFTNGIYIIKIQTPQGEINRKMMISK